MKPCDILEKPLSWVNFSQFSCSVQCRSKV